MNESHGQKLLDELQALKAAGISVAELQACAVAVRPLRSSPPSVVVLRVGELAEEKFKAQPALAALLKEWARTLTTEQAVPELCTHFERLAVVASLLSAMQAGSARWPKEVSSHARR